MSVNKSKLTKSIQDRGQYFTAPNELWTLPISVKAKTTYCYLLAQSDKWNPSLKVIAKDLGISINTARAALKELEDVKMLEVDHSPNGLKNIYLFATIEDWSCQAVSKIDMVCQNMAGGDHIKNCQTVSKIDMVPYQNLIRIQEEEKKKLINSQNSFLQERNQLSSLIKNHPDLNEQFNLLPEEAQTTVLASSDKEVQVSCLKQQVNKHLTPVIEIPTTNLGDFEDLPDHIPPQSILKSFSDASLDVSTKPSNASIPNNKSTPKTSLNNISQEAPTPEAILAAWKSSHPRIDYKRVHEQVAELFSTLKHYGHSKDSLSTSKIIKSTCGANSPKWLVEKVNQAIEDQRELAFAPTIKLQHAAIPDVVPNSVEVFSRASFHSDAAYAMYASALKEGKEIHMMGSVPEYYNQQVYAKSFKKVDVAKLKAERDARLKSNK